MRTFLFFTLLIYGPAVSIMGLLRISEIILISLALLTLPTLLRNLDRQSAILAILMVNTAIWYVFSSIINEVPLGGAISIAGSYVLMACMFLLIIKLINHKDDRFMAALLGYNLAYFLMVVMGNPANEAYQYVPWRLGLGTSVTILLCAYIYQQKTLTRVHVAALLGMGLLHLLLGARAIGLCVFLTSFLAWLSIRQNHQRPQTFSFIRMGQSFALLVFVIFAASQFLQLAIQQRWLPISEIYQAKLETQFDNPNGLILASRPDVAAAMASVQKYPVFGISPNKIDPEVLEYFRTLLIVRNILAPNADDLAETTLEKIRGGRTPNHSHIFGAWADAGIFAALVWFYVLYLVILVMVRFGLWRDPRSPLFIFVALMTLWDLIFSPGPHRIDLIMRLVVLLAATRALGIYDRSTTVQKTIAEPEPGMMQSYSGASAITSKQV